MLGLSSPPTGEREPEECVFESAGSLVLLSKQSPGSRVLSALTTQLKGA